MTTSKGVSRPTEHEIERFRQMQADYRLLSEPFIKLKTDIMATALPTMRLHADGTMETFYDEATNTQLDKVDKLWQETVSAWMKGLAQ